MESRLSLLLGAGVNLDMVPELPHNRSETVVLSTKGLTDVVMSYKYDVIHRRDEIRVFLTDCKDYLIEQGIPEPNFEQIYQLILELYHNKVNTVPRLYYSLPEKFDKVDADLCNTTLYYILNTIYLEVSKVHNQKIPQWAQTFLQHIIKGFDFTDLFTLNYDTLLDGILGEYNDGFRDEGIVKDEWVIPYKTFNESYAMEFDGHNILNHMHGSVLFNRMRPNGEPSPVPIVKDDRPAGNIGTVRPYMTQTGDIVTHSPIITGLDKPNMLIHEPYRTYYGNFLKSLATNRSLLIVGYGFGDFHVNSCIDSFSKCPGKRVVYISPKPPPEQFGDFLESDPKMHINESGSFIWFKGTFKEACENGIEYVAKFLDHNVET